MNKILEYAGQYKKNYFWSVTLVLLAVFAQVIPYLFLYKLVIHIIGIETYTTNQLISYIVIIAICLLLYTFLYTKGLELSHCSLQYFEKSSYLSAGTYGENASGCHYSHRQWYF